nr:hypothetical protein [Escherichia coli]
MVRLNGLCSGWVVFLCVITRYHLNQQLWTPQKSDYTGDYGNPGFLGLLAEPLMELLNKNYAPGTSYLFPNLWTKAPRTVAR